MARALSSSVRLPLTISRAVSRTMPSMGMSSVAAVLKAALLASIFRAGSGLLKSVARLRVENVLMTSSTGAFSPGLHSATTMAAPYLPSRARRALPLLDQLLPPSFWYSPSTDGTGTQTRVAPAGFSTSTCVVIS